MSTRTKKLLESSYLIVLAVVLSVAIPISGVVAAVELGVPAPDFSLTSTNGENVSLSELKGKVVVLEWFNYGCPFVRKHYDPKHMQKLQEEYGDKNEIVWLTINSTHSDHRDFKNSEATNKLPGLMSRCTSPFS